MQYYRLPFRQKIITLVNNIVFLSKYNKEELSFCLSCRYVSIGLLARIHRSLLVWLFYHTYNRLRERVGDVTPCKMLRTLLLASSNIDSSSDCIPDDIMIRLKWCRSGMVQSWYGAGVAWCRDGMVQGCYGAGCYGAGWYGVGGYGAGWYGAGVVSWCRGDMVQGWYGAGMVWCSGGMVQVWYSAGGYGAGVVWCRGGMVQEWYGAGVVWFSVWQHNSKQEKILNLSTTIAKQEKL